MTAVIEQRASLDLSQTPKVPLARLVRVELRKMADTRAGMWLLIAIALITAAIVTIFSFAAPESEHTFLNFMGVTATPQGLLLPVLGILLITSEWSQRTALVTFTLTPVRGHVLTAKVIAALLFGFAAIQTIGVLQGLAFGLVLLNSAGAIVAFLLLPTVFNILAGFWSAMSEARPWVDLAYAQEPLFMDQNLGSDEWLHLASGFPIWVLLPFVVGTIRVLRREVK